MKQQFYLFLKKSLVKNTSNIFAFENKFIIFFPKYKENYIKELWFTLKKMFFFFKSRPILNLKFGFVEIINKSSVTNDPFLVIKIRDFLKLISRGILIQQAAKIFDNRVFCDIIKISKIVSNKNKFLKRRKRLLGKNGTILKIIEILTHCYILIQGNTVSCMGSCYGLKQIWKIVKDCIYNIHPILYIKLLTAKKKYYRSLKFKNQNWQIYLNSTVINDHLFTRFKNHTKNNSKIYLYDLYQTKYEKIKIMYNYKINKRKKLLNSYDLKKIFL